MRGSEQIRDRATSRVGTVVSWSVARLHSVLPARRLYTDGAWNTDVNASPPLGRFPETLLCVGDGEARADRQRGKLIDGVAPGPPIRQLLFV